MHLSPIDTSAPIQINQFWLRFLFVFLGTLSVLRSINLFIYLWYDIAMGKSHQPIGTYVSNIRFYSIISTIFRKFGVVKGFSTRKIIHWIELNRKPIRALSNFSQEKNQMQTILPSIFTHIPILTPLLNCSNHPKLLCIDGSVALAISFAPIETFTYEFIWFFFLVVVVSPLFHFTLYCLFRTF